MEVTLNGDQLGYASKLAQARHAEAIRDRRRDTQNKVVSTPEEAYRYQFLGTRGEAGFMVWMRPVYGNAIRWMKINAFTLPDFIIDGVSIDVKAIDDPMRRLCVPLPKLSPLWVYFLADCSASPTIKLTGWLTGEEVVQHGRLLTKRGKGSEAYYVDRARLHDPDEMLDALARGALLKDHHCHCGKYGQFGFRWVPGRWFCADHRQEGEMHAHAAT